MKTIWKYNLNKDNITVEMPRDSKILCTDEQFGNVCIWVELDPSPSCPTEKRIFEIFDTGETHYEDMGISREYIGTVKLRNGDVLKHVYEKL